MFYLEQIMRRTTFIVLGIFLLSILTIAQASLRESGSYHIAKDVLDNSGGRVESGSYTLQFSLAEGGPAGTVESGSYTLRGGFIGGNPSDACDGCLIGDTCYADQETNPANVCEICDPSISTSSWSSNDGATCDDGLFCNGSDTCADTVCVDHAGDPCVDAIACTTDFCDEILKTCSNTPDDGYCANALYCDGDEYCDTVFGCLAGTAVDCNDGVGCTDDSCNEGTNSCDNVTNDANCDNGQWCDGSETCDSVADCQAGSAPDCSDGVGCTDDSCNEGADSCDNIANHANCGNGQYCDGVEICDTAADCLPGTPPPCDDGISCTDDSCNEVTDSCDNVANDDNCANGLWCDGDETCDPVSDCQAGTPPNCDDTVSCTNDSCNDTLDICEHDADDTLCDNGDWCDGDETCDLTADCQDGTKPCDPLTETCNETTDTCEPLSSCPAGHLCLTALLHGLWNGSAHNCETVMDVYLYDGPTMIDSFFDVTFSVDGEADIDLAGAGVVTDDYTVLIEHLNHINLMTDNPVYLDVAIGNEIDFTEPANVECGTSTMYNMSGLWTMPAGDIVPDDKVSLSDFNYLRLNWTQTDPACDLDCDGFCRLGDFNKLRQTWNTQGCAIPK